MAKPLHRLPEEDRPNIRPDLGVIKGGGETSEPTGQLSSVPDSDVDEGGEESSSLDRPELRALEGGGESSAPSQGHLRSVDNTPSSPGALSTAESGGLYRNEDEKRRFSKKDILLNGGAGYVGEKFGNFAQKHKGLMYGVSIGTGGGVIFLLILVILAASLKLPNVAQNILTLQTARLTRQYARSIDTVSEEKLATEAAAATNDNIALQNIKRINDKLTGYKDAFWGKFGRFNVSKSIEKLSNDPKTNFQVTETKGKITKFSLGDTSYSLKPAGKIAKVGRFVPLIGDYLDFKGRVNLARSFAPALSDALKSNSVGFVFRNGVARRIQLGIGVRLVAYTLNAFKGTSGLDAQVVVEKQSEAAITEPGTTNVPADDIQQAADKAKTAETAGIQDPVQIKQAIDNGGVFPTVRDAITKGVAATRLQSVLKFVNPVYQIALPVCMVYSGSLEKAGPSIDAQTNAQRRTFYYLESAADQQKIGDVTPADTAELGVAVGAMNDKVGDTNQSDIIQQANGNNVDTSTFFSAEASAGGEYTLLNTFMPNDTATLLNHIADAACPKLTSIEGAAAGAGLNIVVGFFSGGSASVAEKGVGEAASEVITNVVEQGIAKRIASKITSKVTTSYLKARALFFDTVKVGVKIEGATFLAKMIVANAAHQQNNGMEQDQDYVNNATSGAAIEASEQERNLLFGRPLTTTEVCASKAADTQYVTYNQSRKSFSDRYISTSNAASLLSRAAITVGAGGPSANIVTRFGSLLMKPLSLFSSLTSLFTNRVYAAVNCNADATNYGNVTFGWSEDEEKLIQSDQSYMPLENAEILLDNGVSSGKLDAITNTYAFCFGYKKSDSYNLDPDAKSTLGNLLAGDSPKIVRDKNGNVLPDPGTCSPNNLGINSPDPNAADPGSSHPNDLIFRWRLYWRYRIGGMDSLDNIQNAETSTSSGTVGA